MRDYVRSVKRLRLCHCGTQVHLQAFEEAACCEGWKEVRTIGRYQSVPVLHSLASLQNMNPMGSQ